MSYMDGTVINGGGCHSAVQSSQPKELQFTNQRMIYDKVMAWQNPVKEGVTAVKAALANINAEIPKSRLSTTQRAQVQVMANRHRTSSPPSRRMDHGACMLLRTL